MFIKLRLDEDDSTLYLADRGKFCPSADISLTTPGVYVFIVLIQYYLCLYKEAKNGLHSHRGLEMFRAYDRVRALR